VLDITPLASYGENCDKGWAEDLYNLAYQRPQRPQKGHNRIRTEQGSIIYTYTAHYPCCEHTLLCTYSTQSTLTYPTHCLRGPKALQAPPKPPTILSSPHSGLECENLTTLDSLPKFSSSSLLLLLLAAPLAAAVVVARA
jgi:hypothetical protein